MEESILDRIPRLERSVRFWRNTSLILAALLLSVGISGLAFLRISHELTTRAMDEAIAKQVEAAEQHAERALQAAKQKQDND